MRNRIEERPVVYLDETWVNAHDSKPRAWVERDRITGGTIGGVKCVAINPVRVRLCSFIL